MPSSTSRSWASKKSEKFLFFNDLTSAQQTIIASVGFQYGNFDRTPKFWSAIVAGDWETVEKELRNFGDNYSKRRKATRNK